MVAARTANPALTRPGTGKLDFWFAPRRFESIRSYEALCVRLLKRYLPTGGDLVLRQLRRRHPPAHLIGTTPRPCAASDAGPAWPKPPA
jgi:hypothetical protein